MKYSLELQDELFGLFIKDATICELLGITDSEDFEFCSNVIRRGVQPAAVINEAPDLFFSYYTVPTYSGFSENYLVNQQVVEFTVYGKFKGQITKLFKAINAVLKRNYEDMRMVAEGDVSSSVTGLYAYMFRVKPLVRS